MAVNNYMERYAKHMQRKSQPRSPSARPETFFDVGSELQSTLNAFFPSPLPKPFKEDGTFNPMFLLLAGGIAAACGAGYYFFVIKKSPAGMVASAVMGR
jgi:hypothetical protein